MTRSSAESHGNFMMVQLHHVRKEERFGSAATDLFGTQVDKQEKAFAGWRNRRMGIVLSDK